MEDRLIVTASPHIREASTTRGLMGNVVIALLPAVIAAGLIFGVQALVLVAVTTLACVAFEYLYEVEQNCLPGGVLGYWETFTSSEDELPEMSILLEQSGVHLEKRVNGAKNTTPFDGYLTCLGPLGDGCCYGYSLQSDNESYSGAFILSVDFGMMAIEPIQPNELFQETLYFGLKS